MENGDYGEEKMATTGKENNSKGQVNVLWMKRDTEACGAKQQRAGQTEANHCRSIVQWSQWSDVNLHELLWVPGKCFGTNNENPARREQSFTLLAAMRGC